MNKKLSKLAVGASLVLMSACTHQDVADGLTAWPQAMIKETCRASSNCRFNNAESGPAANLRPSPHWHEDAYGRDTRILRR